MKSGHGCLSRKRTRCASTISTAATCAFRVAARGALVPLEGELHVLRGERIAVVEPHALAKHELVGEPVLRLRPRLGEAGRPGIARHRLHERVVERVQRQEGGDDARRLGGVEPRRGQRDVDGERDLPLRRAGGRGRQPEGQGPGGQCEAEGDERSGPAALHGGSIHPGPRGATGPAGQPGQSMTAIASTSTTRSGCASLRTSTVVLVGSAPKYSMRTSTCLKNSSMSVT